MKKLLLISNLLLFITYLNAQTAAPPLNMTLHAQWDADTLPTAGSREYNDIWGWVDCSENEYAIIGSSAYIHFFDVTDIDNIQELGFFAGGEVTTWRDMKTYRDRAYAVSENTAEGLMIFDLSNIQDTIIKTYHSNEFFNKAHNIFVDNDNGRLYAVGTNTQSQGVLIFDIETNPDLPVLLASVGLPGGGYVHDIFVRDNIGYCSHGNDGLYIWDFNDPENPIYMADFTSNGYNHSSWVSDDGNTLIYAEEVPLGLPLGVLDISEMESGDINAITTFKFPLLAPNHQNNVPHNPFIRGDYVIVSHYHDGVQIFDISDPEYPAQVAYYDTHANDSYSGYAGCWGVYPFLPSGTIIASDINEGLLVLTADSIDFDPIEATVFPDATLTDNTPSPFCSGEDGQLEIPAGASDYKWFQDGNLVSSDDNTYHPENSGDYYAIVSNQHCSVTSETISIEINPSPDLSGFSTDPVSFCENEPESITAPTGFDSYTWLSNGMTVQNGGETFMVSESGTYNLLVELGPCSSTSSDIEVTIDEAPSAIIEVIGNTISQDDMSISFCENEQVTLQVPDASGATFNWVNNGQAVGTNNNTLEIGQDGNYSVEIISADGCINSSLDLMVTIISVNVDITFENETLSASPGGLSYQWFLNGIAIENATSVDFDPTESGEYTCQIETAEGCTTLSSSLNITLSSNKDIENIHHIGVFPNPTDGPFLLNLKVSEATDLTFKIVHIDGRIIQTFNQSIIGETNIPLDLTSFAKGVYMIQIENDKGIITKKIVKM